MSFRGRQQGGQGVSFLLLRPSSLFRVRAPSLFLPASPASVDRRTHARAHQPPTCVRCAWAPLLLSSEFEFPHLLLNRGLNGRLPEILPILRVGVSDASASGQIVSHIWQFWTSPSNQQRLTRQFYPDQVQFRLETSDWPLPPPRRRDSVSAKRMRKL